MPGTRRRSSTMFSKETIDTANTALQQLPEKPKENLSLREAVAALGGTIRTALDRGYSYEEVAEMLSQQGVKISPTSLKSYLSAIQKTSGGKTTTRRRRTKAEMAAAAEAAAASGEETPKRRGGRKPKAVPETTTSEAPETTTSEAPAPKKRGPKPKTAEAPKTVAKTTRTKATAAVDAGKKPLRSTTSRRKKAV